jgi:hypothetical protein
MISVSSGLAPQAFADSLTTAWHDGAFAENVGGVVSRSDIVIQQPNVSDAQSLPLGNGSLGVAAWAATGSPRSSTAATRCPTGSRRGRSRFPGCPR